MGSASATAPPSSFSDFQAQQSFRRRLGPFNRRRASLNVPFSQEQVKSCDDRTFETVLRDGARTRWIGWTQAGLSTAAPQVIP